MSEIRLKRAYDPAGPEDGTRILVDRLWPRGLPRDHAKVDQWLKDVPCCSRSRSRSGATRRR